MIECIFTIDYEIYGSGEGSLRDLVYEPAERLKALFLKWKTPLVFFVEAAELEKIEQQHSDASIHAVRRQIRQAYREDFEIGLHLHPQWYNACYAQGKWHLDYSEYNLCSLSAERIAWMIERGIKYLRNVLDDRAYMPLSFRAGNWLLQPTETTARILAGAGIKIDSSVFKGGLQRSLGLDYRPALKNGYYWPFHSDVNERDPRGRLVEIPTHTDMVPFWKMMTAKRVGLQHKSSAGPLFSGRTSRRRLLDYCRFRYPCKLDFCRMTLEEFTGTIEKVLREDGKSPDHYKPVVVIGHTKDLVDLAAVESFLDYLKRKNIAATTFREAWQKHPVLRNFEQEQVLQRQGLPVLGRG